MNNNVIKLNDTVVVVPILITLQYMSNNHVLSRQLEFFNELEK